jgi:hypothetical protein
MPLSSITGAIIIPMLVSNRECGAILLAAGETARNNNPA